jgi:hypothetical protein
MAMSKRIAPLSKGNARSAAARRIHLAINRQQANPTLQDTMPRLKDARHVAYVLARTNGETKAQAYSANVSPSESEDEGTAWTFEALHPDLTAAIKAQQAAALQGSKMSSQERADWVLDRLLLESQGQRSAARLKALELIGKTVPSLFKESVRPDTLDLATVRAKLQALLQAAQGRTINGEAQRLPDQSTQATEGTAPMIGMPPMNEYAHAEHRADSADDDDLPDWLRY